MNTCFSARILSTLMMLALGLPALAESPTSMPATQPVQWSGTKVVLNAEESSGGKLVTLADKSQGVVLDSTCELPWPEITRIEWKLATTLPAGWWHGSVDFCVREGDDRGWINKEFGVVLTSPGKPLANMMLNFHPPEKGAGKFEFWTYISTPADGLYLKDVYSSLYKWKRSWPILRVTLEQAQSPALTGNDVIALDLPVQADGTVTLPGSLPAGLWTLRAAMTKDGTMLSQGQDGQTVTAPFAFDQWHRPDTIHWYSTSPIAKLSFKTPAMFRSVELENTIIWPAKPMEAGGQLMQTVDPSRTQSQVLVMVGTNLTAAPPSLATFPRGNKTVVVTTWDDGELTDLHLANILDKLGYHPTFFLVHDKPAVKEMDKLEAMHAEIGSHSWTHPFLQNLPPERVEEECVEMRKFLEGQLHHPVISFAYPNGYQPAYDVDGDYVLRAMRAAGYWSGRTTAGASETVDSIANPLTLATNGFFGDRKGLQKAWEQTRAKDGGIFAFWGHSWQIGHSEEQWKDFETFVTQFARQPDAWYASQGELFTWIWSRKNVSFTVADTSSTKIQVKLSRPWLHPWLAERCPLTLKVPAGVEKVTWQGKEIPVKDGMVEIPWVE